MEDDYAYLPGSQRDALLISYGNPAQDCLAVQKAIPSVSCLICNKLHPLDEEPLAAALRAHQAIIVVEDHFANTGLFSSLCQFAMERDIHNRLYSLAPKGYTMTVGTNPSFFHALHGMDVAGITQKLIEIGAHSTA